MNIIIATLICAGIPTWQLIQNVEHNKLWKAAINIAQIFAYVLLVRQLVA